MSDFERLMRDSLKSVAEDYQGPDPHAARQEFLRRRRRRKVTLWAGGAVAVGATAAIAIVAFMVLGESPETFRRTPPTVTPPVSQREPDVESIPVGEGPDGISVGQDGFAWAITSRSGSLVRIDPLDNSVEEVALDVEEPEDVLAAHGAVWVTDPPTGRVIRYDPATGNEAPALIAAADSNFDLAAGGDDDVWVLDSGDELHRLDGTTGEAAGSWSVGEDPVDVSAYGSEVWIYDRGTGEVLEWDPATQVVVTRARVGVSSSSDDLVVGPQDAWFYRGSDGKLFQIDKESGDVVKKLDVGGTFAGLTIAGDRLWAMVTDEGTGEGTLYQIDLATAKEIEEPIPVPDTPYDVAAGYGSVWVTNNDTGEVTRVSFGEGTRQLHPGGIVFYYSDGQDIWAYDSQFQSSRVTDTREPELSPTLSPNGLWLTFQRGEWDGSVQPRIVRKDVETEDETILGRGVAPSYGPEGQLAFALQDGDTGLTSRFGIVEPDQSGPTFVDVPPDIGLGVVERIEWDASGRELYFQHGGETTQVFVMDLALADPVPVIPRGSEDGSVLVSPSVEGPGILTAIELCCGSYPEPRFDTAELGEIVGQGGDWRPFRSLVGVDDLFEEGPGLSLWAESAGSLDIDGDVGWTTARKRAWFVGNGDEMWLVHDSVPGVRDRVSLSGVRSITVSPGFVNELQHESDSTR